MGDKKKHKDKKDKKKNKDKDRQRKDRKRKQKKRSYSSSSSSDSSDDSSSQSRDKARKKDSKKIKKDKKQIKTQTKVTNPYDFDNKTLPKAMPTFPIGPIGIPSPVGFPPTLMHATPPPPTVQLTAPIQKPKTKQINIFKLLPKLPYGVISFAKLLYSTQFIQEKAYNLLLQEMMDEIEGKVKQQNHKKAISIIGKCKAEIKRQIQIQQQESSKQNAEEKQPIFQNSQILNEQNGRFVQLRKVYAELFGKQ